MEFGRFMDSSSRANMAEQSRRHLYGDQQDDAKARATAEAAALLLRHRLFPRAMAWNVQQHQVATHPPQQQVHHHVTQHQAQHQAQQQANEWRRQQQQYEQEYGQRYDQHGYNAKHHSFGLHMGSNTSNTNSMSGADARPSLVRTTSNTSVSSMNSNSSSGSTMSARRSFPHHNHSSTTRHHHHHQHQKHQVDVTSSFTDQLHAVNLNDQYVGPATAEVPAKAVHEAMNFARSFPLLHATENHHRRQREANGATSSNPFISGTLPTQDAREKLFRTMGKWLDGSSSGNNTANNSRSSITSSTGSTIIAEEGFLQHIPRKHTNDLENLPPPPIQVTVSSFASSSGSVHGSSISPVQPSSYVADPLVNVRRIHVQDPIFETPKPASYMGIPHSVLMESTTNTGAPSPSNSTSSWSVASEPRPRSPPNPVSSYGKKRQRATPAPSLAKALLTGCGAKRCSVDDCGKIAVSKGLCRGHGGGRRCQFTGCTKCAQSRSPYCWAHGGGKRCEAPNCRRSRKTKHYCVDHVEMENTVPLANSAADSDESMEGPPSTVASEVDIVLTTTSAEKCSSDLQQSAGETTAAAKLALSLQLPSLNDALKRSFPAKPSSDVFRSVTVQKQEQARHQVQTFKFDLPKSSG